MMLQVAIYLFILLQLTNTFTTVQSEVSLPPMPTYSYSFNLSSTNIIVFRIYENYGDGSSNGWQDISMKPKLILSYNDSTTTVDIKVICIYRYSHSPYIRYYKGSRAFGYDQFAQYYVAIIDPTKYPTDTIAHASGSFYQAAYSSITSYTYNNSDADQFLAKPVYHASASGWTVTNSNTPNPFIVNNPSVLAYEPVATENISHHYQGTQDTDSILTHVEELLLLKLESGLSFPNTAALRNLAVSTDNNGKVDTAASTGKVDFYRLDEYLSSTSFADATDYGSDGCSEEYIFAPTTAESSENQVYILRVRVPTTFFNSSHPSTIFDSYQDTYFSVSANRNNTLIEAKHDTGKLDIDFFLPKYWTVDSRMLNEYKDEQGYAYVFCVPDHYARELSAKQNDGYSFENRTSAPLLTWGIYTGYALAEASFAIILRYKEPQSSWEGSPTNAQCYPTTESNLPIPNDALGSFTPEAFQGPYEDFLEGHIGIVKKDHPWPSKL